jgi:hypothetical protein
MLYPPMPWTLRPSGVCLAAAYLVKIDRVRPHVPEDLPIVPFLPGYTAGALFLAEYGAGSDLQYNELIVVDAAVKHNGRLMWHVHEILVDSETSFEGGRMLLGVPKCMASFDRDEGVVEIARDGRPYLTWRYGRPCWLLRGRTYLEAVNTDINGSGNMRVCGNDVDAVVGPVRSTVKFHGGLPSTIFVENPLTTVAGKSAKLLLGIPIC